MFRAFARRAVVLAVAASAALGLGFATAVAASAAPVPCTTTPTTSGCQTSKFLAGHVALVGHRIIDTRTNVWGLPDLSNYTGPQASVGIGLIMAKTHFMNSFASAIALVWNDPAMGCASDQWALVEGTGLLPMNFTPLMLTSLGGPTGICYNPGDSVWLEQYQSEAFHEIRYFVGDTSTDKFLANTISVPVGTEFFASGEGVDTSNGTNAGLLPSGTLAFLASTSDILDVNGAHVGYYYNNLPTYTMTGTVSGNAHSPTNPITLQPSTFGAAARNSITVP